MSETSIPQQIPDSGEVVDLTIYGAAVAYTYDGATTYRLPGGDGEAHFVALPDGHSATRVTRRIPSDGEPKPGDIWTDRLGCRYFAVLAKRRTGGDVVELVSQEPDAHAFSSWSSVHAGNLGPISLLYRPEPGPAEVAEAALVAS